MFTNNWQIGFPTENMNVVNPTLNLKVIHTSANFYYILQNIITNKYKEREFLKFKNLWGNRVNQKYLDQFGNLTDDYYGYVYVTYNQWSKKVYIGQRKARPEKTESYFGSGVRITNIKNSKGIYFLKKTILGVCHTKEELIECETECKLFFNSLDKKYGYNLILIDKFPTTKDIPRSKEHCDNISKAKKGKPFKGSLWSKGLTKETDERLRIKSEAQKGKSPANKGQISPHKDKTYEEIFGEEQAKIEKDKRKTPKKKWRNAGDTKWINNSMIETYVKLNEIDSYISKGYIIGRLKGEKT